MSMDTSTEEDEDSFDSNTEAIIFGTSDHSGESMISGPNIASSSSEEDDDHHQQQISTAGGGDGTDELIVSSSASSSSWFTNNNNKQIDQQEAIMIFNVDFRALSSRDAVCNNNEVANVKPKIKDIEELLIDFDSFWEPMDEVVPRELVITPPSWSSIWDPQDVTGIFNVPPLSPLSPQPSFGYSDQVLASYMLIDKSEAEHKYLELNDLCY